MAKAQSDTYFIRIKGLVQGVGFRPFVYRLAQEKQYSGWVENSNRGVLVCIKSNKEAALQFAGMIELNAPEASAIHAIEIWPCDEKIKAGFFIRKSQNLSNEITEISPDIAVCDDCLKDLKKQKHRFYYPLINCTHCGPRFSIIRNLPYDRQQSTMDVFEMCPICRKEYEDVEDRRFHAQPIACNRCGPRYTFFNEQERIQDFQSLLKESVALIEKGKLMAVKGQGGYFLMCDAQNQSAVNKIRQLKGREGKPFAVMFRNSNTAKEWLFINAKEKTLLESWRRPIVILKKKKDLAAGVSNGLDTIGAMLPYMPFHYLFFEASGLKAIVLTSANFSDEPILIDDDEVEKKLSDQVAAIIQYNRIIYNRVDDSLCAVYGEQAVILRRSRSWAPGPVNLGFDGDGIWAAGAELVNSFCLGRGRQAILSQYIGDLKNLATFNFYCESIERFEQMFRLKPSLIVCDLHPDYLSSKYASKRAKALDLPLIKVQHHHAHIASAMAEHGLDQAVIGISCDGVGMGDDGKIWGGELLYCDLNRYERLSHFEYVPMPGGDKASREPWRMALAYLYQTFGNQVPEMDIPGLSHIPSGDKHLLMQAIKKGFNCPLTSSAGRLFDAVAAIIGICSQSKFHAEAPMRLEAIIDPDEKGAYEAEITDVISWKPVIRAIVEDLHNNVSNSKISARFHNTFVNVMLLNANKFSLERKVKKVILSGGTFQNRYLTEQLLKRGKNLGLEIYLQEKIPMNDQGIALGQLAIAAKRRSLGLI